MLAPPFAVADLHSKIFDAWSLHFYAVFGTFWPKNRLVPSFQVASTLWEILDRAAALEAEKPGPIPTKYRSNSGTL